MREVFGLKNENRKLVRGYRDLLIKEGTKKLEKWLALYRSKWA